ncbi:MAG: dephospho-CoA kinase [Candidatus Omnitrophota bacterium]
MRRQKIAKLVLGITGCMGAGKSTVSEMFRTPGCLFIDADRLAHSMLRKGGPVYSRVVRAFGREITGKYGRVDRKKLAEKAFSGKRAAGKLNRIMHGELVKAIRRRLANTRRRLVVVDGALIIETGLADAVDRLLVVIASREKRIARSRKRLALSRQEVCRRMEYQVSQDEKMRFADFIIDNNGRINKTRKQVFEIKKALAL